MGPSVHGPNTLFDKPPCGTSVRATNTRKPDDGFFFSGQRTDKEVTAQDDVLAGSWLVLGRGAALAGSRKRKD